MLHMLIRAASAVFVLLFFFHVSWLMKWCWRVIIIVMIVQSIDVTNRFEEESMIQARSITSRKIVEQNRVDMCVSVSDQPALTSSRCSSWLHWPVAGCVCGWLVRPDTADWCRWSTAHAHTFDRDTPISVATLADISHIGRLLTFEDRSGNCKCTFGLLTCWRLATLG